MTSAQKAGLAAIAAVVAAGGVALVSSQLKTSSQNLKVTMAGYGDCEVAVLSCPLRVRKECREKKDGGLRPSYFRARVRGLSCVNDAGIVSTLLPPRLTRDGGLIAECTDPVGECEAAASCGEDGDGGALCDDDGTSEDRPVKVELQRCGCYNPDAGPCRRPSTDGGPAEYAPMGATIQMPPYVGPGCVRKACVEMPESSQDLGDSWPNECPTQ